MILCLVRGVAKNIGDIGRMKLCQQGRESVPEFAPDTEMNLFFDSIDVIHGVLREKTAVLSHPSRNPLSRQACFQSLAKAGGGEYIFQEGCLRNRFLKKEDKREITAATGGS
jgi:hypothetical protein